MPILSKIMDILFHGEPDPKPSQRSFEQPKPEPLNVEQELTRLGEQTGATDWRHSIVDLMKCFGVDASFANRIELAKELGYQPQARLSDQGTTNVEDTAEMNMWLHKTLMENIIKHGGALKLDK